MIDAGSVLLESESQCALSNATYTAQCRKEQLVTPPTIAGGQPPVPSWVVVSECTCRGAQTCALSTNAAPQYETNALAMTFEVRFHECMTAMAGLPTNDGGPGPRVG